MIRSASPQDRSRRELASLPPATAATRHAGAREHAHARHRRARTGVRHLFIMQSLQSARILSDSLPWALHRLHAQCITRLRRLMTPHDTTDAQESRTKSAAREARGSAGSKVHSATRRPRPLRDASTMLRQALLLALAATPSHGHMSLVSPFPRNAVGKSLRKLPCA